MKNSVFILSLLALIGCSKTHEEPNVELVRNMMESPAIKAQDYDPSRADGRANDIPPDHTVPRGFTPYRYADKPDLAAKMNVNPMPGNLESLERGKKIFNVYCAVCHGETGHGDGTVAAKMAVKVPPLVSDLVKGYTDGYLYHMITAGRGMMGSYANQVLPEDRWAVVNYVRSLAKK